MFLISNETPKLSIAMAPNVDYFSRLSDPLIFTILSFLPFKEAARTSILSKRWRNIWLEAKNYEFNERFFVMSDGEFEVREGIGREAFMQFMRSWIDNYKEADLDKFFLTFSNPQSFREDVLKCITFAVEKNVKVLGIDFSNPMWEEEDEFSYRPATFDLPLNVYGNQSIEALKLFSCNFIAPKLRNFSLLKELSLGYVELQKETLKELLVNCEELVSLSLKRCDIACIEIKKPVNFKLESLVIDKCNIFDWVLIEAPNLKFLKYSGDLCNFDVEGISILKDVELDFGLQSEFEEVGDLLYDILHELSHVKVLTVCSYMLQCIPHGEEPLAMEPPLSVQHLILKTAMHENEFFGIRFFLNSCPLLETLTIESSPTRNILEDYYVPFNWRWTRNLGGINCINILKEVVLNGFRGARDEMDLLKFFINCGRAMEKLKINVSEEVIVEDNELFFQNVQALQRCKKASPHLQISIMLIEDEILVYKF